MKTFKTKNSQDRLGICNFERKDEADVFTEVINILQKTKNVLLGSKRTMPYCDIIEGKCNEGNFTIIYDLNYGVEIKSDLQNVMAFLEKTLNS